MRQHCVFETDIFSHVREVPRCSGMLPYVFWVVFCKLALDGPDWDGSALGEAKHHKCSSGSLPCISRVGLNSAAFADRME